MSVAELRNLFDEARPLIKQWLDLSLQFSSFREAATAKGFDWSQIKALLKAQAQDERDGGDKYVRRIIERAEYASSYAAQLGLMNENKYSDEPVPAAPVKAAAQDREPPGYEHLPPAPKADDAQPEGGIIGGSRANSWQMDEPIPPYLDRRSPAIAVT